MCGCESSVVYSSKSKSSVIRGDNYCGMDIETLEMKLNELKAKKNKTSKESLLRAIIQSQINAFEATPCLYYDVIIKNL